jgi:Rod binding domain-containing protein
MDAPGATHAAAAPIFLGAPAAASLAAAAKGSPEQAREVARQFEEVFLSQLFDQMSMGLKTDGVFGGGPGEGIYRSFLNNAIAQEVSRSGGLGIADAVYREILKLQEAKGHDTEAK